MCKKKLYNLIAHSGIWFLSKFFPEYFAAEPLKPTDRFIEYPFILEHLPSSPTTILDVGGSGSIFPLILRSLGHTTYMIDIREYALSYNLFFVKGNMCVSPFKDDFFDLITAVSSIEHIGLKGCYGQSEDLFGDKKAIKEIYRVLRPNGMFLMTVPFNDTPKITSNHRIYDDKTLKDIMGKFFYNIKTVQSPEGDYKLALITAIK